MKILFVGDLNPPFRSYQRWQALEELGHRVRGHSWVPLGRGFYTRHGFLTRLSSKLGLPLDQTHTNQAILAAIEQEPPDVMFIEKGITVRPGTLDTVRRVSPATRIVSYSEDDMYARHNRSLYYTWGLKLYDFVFTTKSYNCNPDELPSLGARKVIFVDKAYDPRLHRPVAVTPEDVASYGGDVGFIGTYEAERARSMLYLAEHGIKVRVWGGGGWERMQGRHPDLVIEGRPLYGDDYLKGICATRINLCFLRKLNRDLQTDRTMEIPACGAFMLAERTAEHSRLFEEGREAAYFGDDAELADQVRFYLAHEEQRRAIAAAGRQRCLSSGYSHHERLQFMLACVEAAGDR